MRPPVHLIFAGLIEYLGGAVGTAMLGVIFATSASRLRQWHQTCLDALINRDARAVANLRSLDRSSVITTTGSWRLWTSTRRAGDSCGPS